jgi:DNA-directed RNA polymerase specialized sigma24 family protein
MRTAFTCAMEGLRVAEIAERLQIPVPTVGTRWFRRRLQLRRMLEVGAETDAMEVVPPVPVPDLVGRI